MAVVTGGGWGWLVKALRGDRHGPALLTPGSGANVAGGGGGLSHSPPRPRERQPPASGISPGMGTGTGSVAEAGADVGSWAVGQGHQGCRCPQGPGRMGATEVLCHLPSTAPNRLGQMSPARVPRAHGCCAQPACKGRRSNAAAPRAARAPSPQPAFTLPAAGRFATPDIYLTSHLGFCRPAL